MTTLRRRFIVSHLLLAVAMMVVTAVYLTEVYRRAGLAQARADQEAQVARLADRVGELMADRSRLVRVVSRVEADGRLVAVFDDEGRRLAANRTATWTRPPSASLAAAALDGKTSSLAVRRGRTVIAAAPIVVNEEIIGTVFVSGGVRTPTLLGATAGQLVVGGVLVVLSVLAALILAEQLVRPLRRITAAANDLALGRPPPPGAGESGTGIAELLTLDAAVSRLGERAVEARRRSRHADLARLDEMRRASHRLRTPLAVMALRLEELQDAVSGPARHLTDLLQEQFAHLVDVVASLADRARPDGGRTEPVDAVAVVARTLATLEPLARWSKLTVRADLPAEAVVLADPAALVEAVDNLLENALKFCAPGGTVRVVVEPGAHGEVVLVVEDDGLGIDPADLDRVRRPWERGRNVGSIPGSGLGLSLVEEAVAASRGRWDIAPGTGGQGARVTVVLPAAAPGAGAQSNPAATARSRSETSGRAPR